ncbi:MAG: hypothetical protein IPP06_18820 [Saprospiraceae bacterium]|nr:hypothetical protein [Candidatus Vicinibacter affinis]
MSSGVALRRLGHAVGVAHQQLAVQRVDQLGVGGADRVAQPDQRGDVVGVQRAEAAVLGERAAGEIEVGGQRHAVDVEWSSACSGRPRGCRKVTTEPGVDEAAFDQVGVVVRQLERGRVDRVIGLVGTSSERQRESSGNERAETHDHLRGVT